MENLWAVPARALPYKIAKILTEEGIPTPDGKKLWGKAVVDYVTVYGRDDVQFTFKNGIEIKA